MKRSDTCIDASLKWEHVVSPSAAAMASVLPMSDAECAAVVKRPLGFAPEVAKMSPTTKGS